LVNTSGNITSGALALFTGILLLLPAISSGEEILHHQISVALDPQARSVRASDVLTVPGSLFADDGRKLSFALHEGLAPSSPTPGVVLRKTGSRGSTPGIETYSAELPPSLRTFTLLYGGVIDHPLEEVGREYARGQRQTPARIFEDGAYLSPRSSWYPDFGGALFSFSLSVEVPAAWDAVSQGKRTRHTVDAATRRVRWEEKVPQDSIFLLAGPYTEYARRESGPEAMVFLRSPDEALANRYLEATLQYVAMYDDFIGPYPYDKFALVENFWETGYGMPSFTLLGPKVIRFPFILHSSYPHEILHNWWGNGVYIDYESGNWGEGLTAYLADHLIKEQRNQGADYRLTTLQKYADYVTSGRDLPLADFRSRHGSVSEAVGYGKSLMLFHMLRRKLGDDAFREGLRFFYAEHRATVASFGDLEGAFAQAAGESLDAFFEQWLSRTGAPRLEAEGVGIERDGEGYILRGTLRQTQVEEPFLIDVPLAVTLSGRDEAVERIVPMSGRSVSFELPFSSIPLRADIDPAFDLFRRLDPLEIPPALTMAFGADEALILLPSSSDSGTLAAYRQLATSLSRTGPGSVKVAVDSEFENLPSDRSVWLLGWDNRFLPQMMQAIGGEDLDAGESTLLLGRSRLPRGDHAFVLTARHPDSPSLALLWIGVDNLDAIPGLARKLPHYHKQSYLAFSGDEPANVAKGRWPVRESPLIFNLAGDGGALASHGALPKRSSLAELEPLFSRENLLDSIAYLASPELGGRGPGSPGLESAARYIADSFASAGLEPGGNQAGSYFQTWTHKGDGDSEEMTLRNVIGIIPGTLPEREGEQVVIGAHYDHLGLGDRSAGTGVRRENEGLFHPGADDNASGVALLLELARLLGRGWKPERTVVFAAFTAEEIGKVGSRHYVENLAGPPPQSCRAMVNLDTVGRLRDGKLMILGGSSARDWVHIFRGPGYLAGVEVEMVSEDLDSSDHVSFLEKGIPAVQLFTGPHLDYHRPGDTPDRIDADGLLRLAALTKEVLQYLAAREEPLGSASPTGGQTRKNASSREAPRKSSLGTVPDFSFSGPGVRLTGTVPGSPAEKAGLREGDVLHTLGRAGIASLRDLAAALRSLSPGTTVAIGFSRDGRDLNAEAVLDDR
jgi:hypothetical protein